MNFNSFPFLFIFLPGAILVFYLLGMRLRLSFVLAATSLLSLTFYAYSDWRLLLILIPAVIGNFFFGLLLQQKPTRLGLGFGVGLNIALLVFFKYFNFLNANIALLLGYKFEGLHIMLPLAISFYTFQQIAFLVDCFRGLAVERSIIRYFFFICFFAQLNQGPILRHSQLALQINNPAIPKFDARNFSIGLMLLSMGFAKKILIADQCGIWADAAFADPATIGLLGAWLGALAYTMQIYFDFSGYTDMALGIGRFFNINLPINFNSPYKAVSFTDFWQRWHITLSLFLRDYLYIPLGGNRAGRIRQIRNIMITMLLGGLWHGANWTFLLWGCFHGFFIVLTHLWRMTGIHIPCSVSRALTFLGILVGWVVFRASSFGQAFQMLAAMANWHSLGGIETSPGGPAAIIFLSMLLAFVNLAPNSIQIASEVRINLRYALFFALLFFLALLGMYDGDLTVIPNQFIYQNF